MNKPQIGMYINDSRLGRCIIVAVHKFGTIDVMNSKGRHFRITGLAFI